MTPRRMLLASALMFSVCTVGCAKPCEGEWPGKPGGAWEAHPELVPPRAMVCMSTPTSATMDVETSANPFVLVVQAAEANGWQRSRQDISKDDLQSVTLTRQGRNLVVHFRKVNGTYTRVLATELN